MNILMISLAYDPAGVGQMLCNSINSKTKHTCKHLLPTGYLITERDKAINRVNIFQASKDEIVDEINKADILHIHQVTPFQKKEIGPAADRFGKWNEILSKKPWILHNHGGAFLINPPKFMKDIENYNPHLFLCSPLNKILFNNATWLQNIIPLNESLYMPVQRNFDKTLKIAHKIWFESTKMYKGTDVLIEVCDLLKKDGFDIDFKVYSNMNIDICLRKSAEDHICIDNLTQGFIGMSGWESLAKGQVVIARLDPIVVKAYKELCGNVKLPIINVTGMDELAKVIRELHDDRDKLKELCDYSRKWMEQYYNEDLIVKKYIEKYEEIIKNHSPNTRIKHQSYEVPKIIKEEISKNTKQHGWSDARQNFEELPFKDPTTKLDGLMGSGMFNSYEIEKIDQFFKRVGLIHNRKFIDCGVGVGRLTPVVLKSKPKSYTGMDFSSSMVKEFKKNFPDISCYQQDIANMPQLKDKFFDTSFVIYVLIHITDSEELKKAAEELKRITRQYIIIGHDTTIPIEFQEKIAKNICRFVPREELEKLFQPWKIKYYFPNYYKLYSPYDNDLDSKISFIVFENPKGIKPINEEFK